MLSRAREYETVLLNQVGMDKQSPSGSALLSPLDQLANHFNGFDRSRETIPARSIFAKLGITAGILVCFLKVPDMQQNCIINDSSVSTLFPLPMSFDRWIPHWLLPPCVALAIQPLVPSHYSAATRTVRNFLRVFETRFLRSNIPWPY